MRMPKGGFVADVFYQYSSNIFVNYLVLSQNVMKELLATNIVYDVDICMEDPFFTMNFILSSMVFGTAYYEEKKMVFKIL